MVEPCVSEANVLTLQAYMHVCTHRHIDTDTHTHTPAAQQYFLCSFIKEDLLYLL